MHVCTHINLGLSCRPATLLEMPVQLILKKLSQFIFKTWPIDEFGGITGYSFLIVHITLVLRNDIR